MKRFTIVLALLITGMALFANGAKEQGTGDREYRDTVQVSITTEGIIEVTEDEVLLETAEGTYSLSARGGRLVDLDSIDGKQVEVTGAVKECEDCDEPSDGHIFVFEASGDDLSYEFDDRNPRDMREMDTRRNSDSRSQNSERQRPSGNRDQDRRDTDRGNGQDRSNQRDSDSRSQNSQGQRPSGNRDQDMREHGNYQELTDQRGNQGEYMDKYSFERAQGESRRGSNLI